MRKVIALLFACMCIFSSCSAKGYWMAKDPVARTDGTYHIQDQIPYSSEGTRIFKDGEPTELFIYLDDIIVSDGMMDVIIPIKAHNANYNGTELTFTLVKINLDNDIFSVVAEKHFVSPTYNVVPNVSDWRDMYITRKYASLWSIPLSWYNVDNIVNHLRIMLKQGMYKRYEFMEY